MNNFDKLIEGLSNTPLTKYVDDDGRIHFTTKTPEQLAEEKERKLTQEKGPICSTCGKRNKSYRIDINKDILCKKCYSKTWDETTVKEDEITVNVVCPYCGIKLNIPLEIKDECKCGAIYDSGFKDEFYYNIEFYKRK